MNEALDEMKGMRLGLINVVKAIHVVEGVSYSDAVELLESRGDYREFDAWAD